MIRIETLSGDIYQNIYIDENVKTYGHLYKYIKKPITKYADALEYVPNEMKTAEICNIAVEHNGYAIRFVPNEIKTEEICRTAVRDNSCALQYIPSEFKNIEMFMIDSREKSYSYIVLD